MDAVSRMNDIYRYQRHVYDISRKAFLFGRDTLLQRMHLREGARVLEVGCGTARNLLKLHAKQGSLELFGLDASTEMLETARWKLARRRLGQSVRLQHGLAEELCPQRNFGVPGFDVIFFSYSLSMIPACTPSIDAALASLSPGGSVHIVDFCDQAGFHPLLRKPLQKWLSLFGVEHRPELVEHLSALAARGSGDLTSETFAARYGMWLTFTKK